MMLRLALPFVLALGTAAHAQDSAPLTCSGVDALGRTVERPCSVTAPDPLRTTGVYSEEERLDTDAERNQARLRELDRLAKPLPRQKREPAFNPEFKVGVGPYKLDNSAETRERIERERTDPYAIDPEETD